MLTKLIPNWCLLELYKVLPCVVVVWLAWVFMKAIWYWSIKLVLKHNESSPRASAYGSSDPIQNFLPYSPLPKKMKRIVRKYGISEQNQFNQQTEAGLAQCGLHSVPRENQLLHMGNLCAWVKKIRGYGSNYGKGKFPPLYHVFTLNHPPPLQILINSTKQVRTNVVLNIAWSWNSLALTPKSSLGMVW